MDAGKRELKVGDVVWIHQTGFNPWLGIITYEFGTGNNKGFGINYPGVNTSRAAQSLTLASDEEAMLFILEMCA